MSDSILAAFQAAAEAIAAERRTATERAQANAADIVERRTTTATDLLAGLFAGLDEEHDPVTDGLGPQRQQPFTTADLHDLINNN